MASSWSSHLAVVCLSVGAAFVTQPVVAESTVDPVVARAEALVELIRSEPDEDAIGRFAAAHFAASSLAQRPAETLARGLMRVFADLRGGDVESVRILGPERAEIVAHGRDDLWLTFELDVESTPPHGILGFRVRAEQQPPEDRGAVGDSSPLDEAEALSRIDAEIALRARADRFSGVVLLARGGVPFYSKAVGMADRSFGIPNETDTRFNLGSINKIFTSVVVHQLAAEGRLRLDAPLIEALPDYPNREIAAEITPRQLLEHASGLGDFFNDSYHDSSRDRFRSLSDYLPLFVDRPLEFAPGSRRRYSNAGYLVLGLVIERLTLDSYYDAVRKRIFEPAGMTDTASWAVDDIVPNRAVGYTQGHEGERDPALPLRSNVLALPARGSSAGGGYSTAPDLLKFATALVDGRLLPPGAGGPGAGIGIAGGSDGVNAALEIGEPGEPTIVVLSNLDPPSAESLSRYARELLRRVN